MGDWSTLSAQCDVTGFVEVGESVFMGSGARIIPSKTVGASSIVGAGSVVIRDVASATSVFGNQHADFLATNPAGLFHLQIRAIGLTLQ